jgi:hypothetical protein
LAAQVWGPKSWYRTNIAVKTTSIALAKPHTEFTRRKVEFGKFDSTSEVMCETARNCPAPGVHEIP